jgi:hypothetical protein
LDLGRVVTINQVAKLYGTTYMKVASVKTVVYGFQNIGMHQWMQMFFPNWIFQPFQTTD